jgi:hypothetical protein
MVLKPRKNIQVFDSCNFLVHHFSSFIKNNFLFTRLTPPEPLHHLPSTVNKRIIRIFISGLAKKEAVPKSALFAFETAWNHIKI